MIKTLFRINCYFVSISFYATSLLNKQTLYFRLWAIEGGPYFWFVRFEFVIVFCFVCVSTVLVSAGYKGAHVLYCVCVFSVG